jgi:uncharacterized ion transporter superfamily protein YfcC
MLAVSEGEIISTEDLPVNQQEKRPLPETDLTGGVSRHVAVLAFLLGDGLTNIIVPTSAALIGTLGAARIDWGVWAKFIGKFILQLVAVSIIFIIIAVSIGL